MKRILSLMVVLFTTGCDVVLYEKLTQREANQIVSALRQSGIDAKRIAIEEELFSVEVAEDDFSNAIVILEEHGLPQERLDSIADVFDADGLISTPLQERARLAYALSQELTRSLIGINGITDARVHLTLSRERPLTNEQVPATASVLLNHLSDFDIETIIPDIKLLVAKGVPDLSYRNVSVVALVEKARPSITQTLPTTPVTKNAATFALGSLPWQPVALFAFILLTLVVATAYAAVSGREALYSLLRPRKPFMEGSGRSEDMSANHAATD